MTMPSTTRLVAALSILTGLAGPANAQDVTLQYRWDKGEEIRYRFVQHSTTNISGLPGGLPEMNVDLQMSQVLRTKVDDVAADGTATLNYRYESVRWDMASPMGTMTYDTAAPDASGASAMPGPMKDILSTFVGESFVLVISRQGAVQKVEGMDRLMEKAFKNLPSNPALAQMLQGLKNSFSDDGMRAAFAQGYSQFPDRSLKAGESWEVQTTISNPMVGRMTTTSGFTLKGIEGSGANRVARIATKLTMKTDQTPTGLGPMGLKMQLGESSGEGEMTFDVAKGRLQQGTTRTTMPITMSGTGPDGSAMNMQTVIKSTITIELLPSSAGR